MPAARRITSILITFLAFSSGVPAEDEAHSDARLAQPGHSIHGEAFNEEKDAKDWIKTNDGTTWAANAVSYSLAMFDIEVK